MNKEAVIYSSVLFGEYQEQNSAILQHTQSAKCPARDLPPGLISWSARNLIAIASQVSPDKKTAINVSCPSIIIVEADDPSVCFSLSIPHKVFLTHLQWMDFGNFFLSCDEQGHVLIWSMNNNINEWDIKKEWSVGERTIYCSWLPTQKQYSADFMLSDLLNEEKPGLPELHQNSFKSMHGYYQILVVTTTGKIQLLLDDMNGKSMTMSCTLSELSGRPIVKADAMIDQTETLYIAVQTADDSLLLFAVTLSQIQKGLAVKFVCHLPKLQGKLDCLKWMREGTNSEELLIICTENGSETVAHRLVGECTPSEKNGAKVHKSIWTVAKTIKFEAYGDLVDVVELIDTKRLLLYYSSGRYHVLDKEKWSACFKTDVLLSLRQDISALKLTKRASAKGSRDTLPSSSTSPGSLTTADLLRQPSDEASSRDTLHPSASGSTLDFLKSTILDIDNQEDSTSHESSDLMSTINFDQLNDLSDDEKKEVSMLSIAEGLSRTEVPVKQEPYVKDDPSFAGNKRRGSSASTPIKDTKRARLTKDQESTSAASEVGCRFSNIALSANHSCLVRLSEDSRSFSVVSLEDVAYCDTNDIDVIAVAAIKRYVLAIYSQKNWWDVTQSILCLGKQHPDLLDRLMYEMAVFADKSKLPRNVASVLPFFFISLLKYMPSRESLLNGIYYYERLCFIHRVFTMNATVPANLETLIASSTKKEGNITDILSVSFDCDLKPDSLVSLMPFATWALKLSRTILAQCHSFILDFDAVPRLETYSTLILISTKLGREKLMESLVYVELLKRSLLQRKAHLEKEMKDKKNSTATSIEATDFMDHLVVLTDCCDILSLITPLWQMLMRILTVFNAFQRLPSAEIQDRRYLIVDNHARGWTDWFVKWNMQSKLGNAVVGDYLKKLHSVMKQMTAGLKDINRLCPLEKLKTVNISLNQCYETHTKKEGCTKRLPDNRHDSGDVWDNIRLLPFFAGEERRQCQSCKQETIIGLKKKALSTNTDDSQENSLWWSEKIYLSADNSRIQPVWWYSHWSKSCPCGGFWKLVTSS